VTDSEVDTVKTDGSGNCNERKLSEKVEGLFNGIPRGF